MKKFDTKTSLAATALAAAIAIPSAVLSADYGRPPPGAGAGVDSPCYAVFHEYRDGQGLSLERHGPEDVPRIRDLRYSDGGTLNTRVLSVTTGPGAVLMLYNASRYRLPMFEVGPESRVNLARPEMDSYELRCLLPAAPPPQALPPGFK